MSEQEKLDLILKELVTLKTIISGANGSGGMCHDINNLGGKITVNGNRISELSQEISNALNDIRHIEKDVDKHSTQISELYSLGNQDRVNNTKTATKTAVIYSVVIGVVMLVVSLFIKASQ